MKQKILKQGAEAKIYLEDKKISKQRVSKSYRHPKLDTSLRKSRTKKEANILEKAHALGCSVPKVLSKNTSTLELEYLKGDVLSEKLNVYSKQKQLDIMKQIGKQVAHLHAASIIHGDLTTSNMISRDSKVFIIDFGLGYISHKIEDKAVDLHVLKQALVAKHWKNHGELFRSFLRGYKHKDSEKITERLEVVEKRGRYKH